MKTVIFVMAIGLAAFGKETDKDCIYFNEEIPEYTRVELDAIEKYYPQIAQANPTAVATHFLSSVKMNKDGYTFSFLDLESMRSHECKVYGLYTMVMDGGFDVFINETTRMIEWNSGILDSKVPLQGK